MTDFYAHVGPVDFWKGGSNEFGPLLSLRLAAVNDTCVFTFDGSTITQTLKTQSEGVASPDMTLPEPLVRKLYEALQQYYGGVPNSSVQKVLEEALEVERRRVDKILARAQ